LHIESYRHFSEQLDPKIAWVEKFAQINGNKCAANEIDFLARENERIMDIAGFLSPDGCMVMGWDFWLKVIHLPHIQSVY